MLHINGTGRSFIQVIPSCEKPQFVVQVPLNHKLGHLHSAKVR